MTAGEPPDLSRLRSSYSNHSLIGGLMDKPIVIEKSHTHLHSWALMRFGAQALSPKIALQDIILACPYDHISIHDLCGSRCHS